MINSSMHIGRVRLGKRPVVVGTVGTSLIKPPENIALIDILEARVDMMIGHHKTKDIKEVTLWVRSLKERFRKPIILTVRSAKEGGAVRLDDKKRYEIIKGSISYVDAVDVELSSKGLLNEVSELCSKRKKLLMASYHNFQMTPKDDFLRGLIKKGRAMGADIVKIAVRANNVDDLVRLILFTIKNKKENAVTLSMGEAGLISRIINPIIGSLMTYGFIDNMAAPNQLSAFECIEHLKKFSPDYRRGIPLRE